jgi:DNA-binding transcriptional MerR regulator
VLISELAARCDVPVATVKYYLREGLLPAGLAVSPRRAEYDESHVHRLQVLRMLREVGGVPVITIGTIIEAVENTGGDVHERLCQIADALTPELETQHNDDSTAIVDDMLAEVGWTGVRHDAASRTRLVALMRLLASPEWPLTIGAAELGYYARLMDGLCRTEVGLIDETKDGASTLEDMVTGEAACGELIRLLRRLAHEHLHAVGIRPGSVA